LYLATVATQSGESRVSMTAEDKNCSGSTMNWLIPMSASCCRSSSASALDSEATITEISAAASSVTATPTAPPGNRAPASSAIPRMTKVCSNVVSAW
jgi:hypothetical protein